MTNRARQVLEDAMSLSEDERLELAEQLWSSVPLDEEWRAEIERRARQALADPDGGVPWELAKQRINARFEK